MEFIQRKRPFVVFNVLGGLYMVLPPTAEARIVELAELLDLWIYV